MPAVSGVLANDNDPDGGAVTVTTMPTMSTNGGPVSMLADGSFTYTPPPGFTGADTFGYTITDDEATTDPATVTVTVSNMVWYVDATAASAGANGTSTKPFPCLVGVGADCYSTTANDQNGNTIFLADGTYNDTEKLVLANGQKLIGDGSSTNLATASGITFAPNSVVPNGGNFSGTDPLITSTAVGIQVVNNNTIRGVTVGNTTGVGLYADGADPVGATAVSETSLNGTGRRVDLPKVTGTTLQFDNISTTSATGHAVKFSSLGTGTVVNINAGSISGATGNGIEIEGGTATYSIAASVSGSTARSVQVRNVLNPSGAINFTGSIGGSGPIFLENNDGTTVTFSGGISLSTGASEAFAAEDGGTVVVTGTNTVTTTTGIGVRIENTTIGGSGVTFRSVNAGTWGGGPAKGITLNNTGTGSFTVTGISTTAGSGGTIQDAAAGSTMTRGIELINAQNISLSNMNLTNANRVQGAVSDGVTGGNENTDENGAMHLQTVTNVTLTNVHINGAVQHGINANLVTNFDITDSTINNVGNAVWESGIYMFNLKGLASASRTNVWNNLDISGTGQFNIGIFNTVGTNPVGGEKDRLEIDGSDLADSGTNTIGDHVTVFNSVNGNFNVIVSDSTFTSTVGGTYAGAHTSDGIQVDASGAASFSAAVTGGTFTGAGQTAINMSASGTGTGTFTVANNNITVRAGPGINVNANGTSDLAGTLSGNTLATSVSNNPAAAITTVANFTGTSIILYVTNNTITGSSPNYFDQGIRAHARESGTMDIVMQDNSVQVVRFEGVDISAGNGTSGEAAVLCAKFVSNLIDSDLGFDYLLSQYIGTTFKIEGLTGSGTSAANVAAFVSATDDDATADPVVEAAGGNLVSYTNAGCASQPAAVVTAIGGSHPSFVSRIAQPFAEGRDDASVSAAPVRLSGGWLGDFASATRAVGWLPDAPAAVSAAPAAPRRSLDGMTFVSSDPLEAAAAAMAPAGETVNLALGTLNANQMVTITFQATVSNTPSATQVCNQGTFTYDTAQSVLTDDPSVGGATDPTCTPIALPDMTATKSHTPAGDIALGGSYTWTIHVENEGDAPAFFPNGTQLIRDDLPAGATYSSLGLSNISGVDNSAALQCSNSFASPPAGFACVAVVQTVIVQPGGSFDAFFTVTPTATGTLDNPRAGGVCLADYSSAVFESDEANNGCAETVTVVAPDLTAVKTHSPSGDVPFGTNWVWNIHIANGGNADAVFAPNSAILDDLLPNSNVTYSALTKANFSGVTNSGNISCSLANGVNASLGCFAVGASVTIAAGGSFDVQVTAAASQPGTYANPRSSICKVDNNGNPGAVVESNESNNTCSETVTVLPPDLQVVKSNSVAGNVTLGNTWQWRMLVTNAGGGGAIFAQDDVIFRDELPTTNVTYGGVSITNESGISGTGTISCAEASGVLTCTASGGTVIIAPPSGGFRANIVVTPSAVGTYTNPRTSGECAVDPSTNVAEGNELNNDCNSDSVVVTAPDLTATKTNNTGGGGVIGTPWTWSIRIDNAGNNSASWTSGQAVFRDDLPAGLTYGTPTSQPSPFGGVIGTLSCAIAADVLTCSASGGDYTIGAVDYVTISFTATATASGTYDNPPSASTCATDPNNDNVESNEANNDCSDTVVVSSIDLVLDKDDNTASAVATGGTIVYTLDYSNDGDDNATGVVITETVPANTTFDNANSTASWTCTPDNNAGSTCTFTVGALASNASGSVDFAVTVNNTVAAGAGDISNTATIADDGALGPDTNPADNTAMETTPLDAAPDLALTKSDGGVTKTPGDVIIYTLSYVNNGDQGATGVVLTETVPANTTFNAGASSVGWVCTPDNNAGSTCTLAIGGLAASANGNATFAVTVVNPLPAGVTQVSNTASIADDAANGTDPAGDNSGNDTTPTTAVPDMTVSKTDGGVSTTPGGTVSYTLTYANNGNQGATGVVLTETVPVNTTFNAGASTAGWVCTPNNNAGSTCTLAAGAVAGGGAGGGVTFAMTVVNPVPAGVTQISNTASIADDGANGTDSNTGNNTANDTTPLTAAPDLTIDKDDGGDTAEPGDVIVYTLTYANNGNQGATGVVITETVPANTAFNAGQSSGTWVCAPDNNAGSTCTTTIGGLAGGGAGSSVDFAVTVNSSVPAGVTEISNTASTADDGANGADANGADNSEGDTTPLTAQPDMAIDKDDGGASVPPGGTAAYQLGYSNVGDQGATGVVITETVPANTTFNAGASSGGWVCVPNGNAGSTCTYTVGAVAAGAGGVVTFAVTLDDPLPGGVTEIQNTASIADDGANGADPDTDNNSDSDTTLSLSADLEVTKTDSADPVLIPSSFTYTVAVTNNGPDDATGIVVADTLTLPAGVTLTGWNPSQGTFNNITGVWTVGNLANGQTATLTLTIGVSRSAAPGSVVQNTAAVTDQYPPDTNAGNNSDSEDTTITAPPCGPRPRATNPTPTPTPVCVPAGTTTPTATATATASPTPSPTPIGGTPTPTRTPNLTRTPAPTGPTPRTLANDGLVTVMHELNIW